MDAIQKRDDEIERLTKVIQELEKQLLHYTLKEIEEKMKGLNE